MKMKKKTGFYQEWANVLFTLKVSQNKIICYSRLTEIPSKYMFLTPENSDLQNIP